MFIWKNSDESHVILILFLKGGSNEVPSAMNSQLSCTGALQFFRAGIRLIHVLQSKMSEWVEVLVTSDVLEVEMVRSLLESGGIEVVVRSSKVSPYPVNIGKMGDIKVLVMAQDKEMAEQVIWGQSRNSISE